MLSVIFWGVIIYITIYTVLMVISWIIEDIDING